MRKELKQKGRVLTHLLRHAPEKYGVSLNPQGYAEVQDIIKILDITEDDLEDIVRNDNKGRFSYLGNKIRANQGHSIKVDLGYQESVPPNILYHGTSKNAYDKIKQTSINKMQRHHVHLSSDIETAKQVGSRRKGDLVIIKINAEKMWRDGIKFYRSENGVWLTDEVLPKYFIED
jgi:putative RNA 2'-phosphotransferase